MSTNFSKNKAELTWGLTGAPEFAFGKTINDKYRLERLIGKGGMGTVFGATQLDSNTKRAVKILHPHLTSDQDTVSRFLQEALIPRLIAHRNVCPVTDVGTIEEVSSYIVMPLLSGCTLSTLAQKEQLSVRRILGIVCQLLGALDTAHKVGVVHRDIKPDNIFISKSPAGGDHVRLLDFGVSKVNNFHRASHLTQSGIFLGTPTYMAPEQARGDRSCDHRVDLYAVGVLLYKLLTGQVPFEGNSYNEVVYKILNVSYAFPRIHNPHIPCDLEQIILKAMSKDADDRFGVASDMREALLPQVPRSSLVCGKKIQQGRLHAPTKNQRMAVPIENTVRY